MPEDVGGEGRGRFEEQLARIRILNYCLRFEEACTALAQLKGQRVPRECVEVLQSLEHAVELNLRSYEYQQLLPVLGQAGGWAAAYARILRPAWRPSIAGTWKVEYQRPGKLKISGQVHTPSERAFIFADDVLVKSVSTQPALATTMPYRQFSFVLQGRLLAALPASVDVAVATEGGPLLYTTKRCTARVVRQLKVTEGKGSLRAQLAGGWLVTKKGTFVLRRDMNVEWQRRVLSFYMAVNEYFEKTFQYRLWLIYGSLLGLCRAGTFIPHDDDFDVAFLSRCQNPEDIRREIVEIANRMITDGWPVRVSANGVLAPVNKKGNKLLDIYSAWLHEGRLFAQSTTAIPMTRGDLCPPQSTTFSGHKVWIPEKPEAFLAGKYGRHWRHPDPSYRKRMSPHAGELLAAARPGVDDRAEIDRRSERLLSAGEPAPDYQRVM